MQSAFLLANQVASLVVCVTRKDNIIYSALIFTCITLILLFAPLVLWSPPWSDHGYYKMDNFPPYLLSTYQPRIKTVINFGEFVAILKIDQLNMGRYRQDLYDDFIRTENKIMNPFTLWQIKHQKWTAEAP